MKEYECIKDFYIEGVKFATKGQLVTLLPDNCTIVNTSSANSQKVTHMTEILKDTKHFKELKIAEDVVNHPSHYASSSIECIDAMIAAYGKEAVMHFCQCNAFKYQWRFNKKNGVEDLKKAEWYNNKYIELKNGD